jgi:quinol monooxygenase YgiN
MIYVVATLDVQPGHDAEIRAGFAAGRAETLKEAGCLAYELHRSLTDPNRYVFVEQWETREALTAHSNTPHLAAWRAVIAPFLIHRRIEIIYPANVEVF